MSSSLLTQNGRPFLAKVLLPVGGRPNGDHISIHQSTLCNLDIDGRKIKKHTHFLRFCIMSYRQNILNGIEHTINNKIYIK